MGKSRLIPIIQRLQAMQEDTNDEVQVRRFEHESVEKCLVTYNQKTKTFQLDDQVANKTYSFDNIDFVAIEILELLQNSEEIK